MKSEVWVRDMLQRNEDLCHKNKLTELDVEKIKNDYFPTLDDISRDLIIRALFTGRNQTLRDILELDDIKVKEKEKENNNKKKIVNKVKEKTQSKPKKLKLSTS